MIFNSFDMTVMFYNKDLFDKYHLAYPTNNWTMKDVVKAAKVLSVDLDGDGKLDQWGFSPSSFQNYVIRNGGSVYSEDGTKCLLDQPIAIEGIQKMVDLTVKYKVVPRATDAVTFLY
jgi:multiple sugar transport system substrate-binding protein